MPADGQHFGRKVIDSPRRLYVSYLTTEAIAECMIDIERRLADISEQMSQQTRESYKTIWRDLDEELQARQMILFDQR